MTFNEYQHLAARTINHDLTSLGQEHHALYGLPAEVGEITGMFQKEMQGHKISEDALKKEVGDVLWMLAELCTAWSWDMDEVAELNIEKLRKRYPDGFSAERSLHRAE